MLFRPVESSLARLAYALRMTQTAPQTTALPTRPVPLARVAALSGIRRFIQDYFWLILKNVIGWLFILSSPLLGVALPGPGGIPVFLIGFALVTFPGKRRLTSRVIRGKPIEVEPIFFTFLVTLISI